MSKTGDLRPECLACLANLGLGPGDRIPKIRRRGLAEWRAELTDLPTSGHGKMRTLRSISQRTGCSLDHLRRIERTLRRQALDQG